MLSPQPGEIEVELDFLPRFGGIEFLSVVTLPSGDVARSGGDGKHRMATVVEPDVEPVLMTVADLNRRFGPIPIARIRMHPAPGTAAEADLLRELERGDALCELVAGILVEKPAGWEESRLASWIVTLISNFVRAKRLGSVLGPDGPIRFGPGLIRLPDVSFFSSGRLPAGKFSNSAILPVAPNLAIEVLSRSNTAREMRQKLKEYFKAGVELVWFVDLRARTVEVFTAVDRSELLDVADTLTGGKVLRGFKVAVRELFDVCDQ